MKRVISTGPLLIAGLMLLLFCGTLIAKTLPASYVKPGVDLSIYNKVLVKPLNMDNIEVLKPAWEQDNDDVWSFEPENRQAIQEWFMDAMQKELEAKGGYSMVSQPASDVMRIEVELLSITPYVKPGTMANDGKFKTQTLGSGDVVVSAEFRDSKTRELLILVEGERTIGTEYKKLSVENHTANVKGLFATWGKKVREALDKAHNK
ncbi:DUF3313 family protein [Pseudomonadota bacterium]